MSFKVTTSTKSESSSAPKIDYNALNEYLVETAGLHDPETVVGYVSMLVDLGNQEQADAEVPFVGSSEEEEKELDKKEGAYFKDGINEKTKKPTRLFCYPQPPKQAVAIAVDFPDILVDKGKFFGDPNPLPLRLWLGGSFWLGADIGMVVARPAFLKENTKFGNGLWSLDSKNVLYQMAVSAGLVKQGEVFRPTQIDQILGTAHQFSAQVCFTENKGKQYYTEKLKFVGKLGRGQAMPELLTTPHMIQLDDENEEDAVRFLPNFVVNTIKRANNFEGSKLQEQLANRTYDKPAEKEEKAEAPAPAKPVAKAKPVVKKPVVEDDLDETSPF
jgi:hypothetical protein